MATSIRPWLITITIYGEIDRNCVLAGSIHSGIQEQCEVQSACGQAGMMNDGILCFLFWG